MSNIEEVIFISQSIIDDSMQSIPVSSDWQAGTGSGANLQVTGQGRVNLGGLNSYSGSTTVSSGILNLVNGTLYAGGVGINSQVSVAQGAVLKGIGTINAPTTVLGILSPGESIGTLHYNAPLILVGNLSIQINPMAGDNSQITSTSTVDVTTATIDIVLNAGTYNVGSQYTLLTSAGLTGSPTLNMPPQFSGVLSYPNNSIVLTILSLPPPPPHPPPLPIDPLPPYSFKGKVIKNSFLTQTDRTNVLKWSPPVNFSEIVSYEIRRNGVVIAVVPASNSRVYYDHNKKKNKTYIYTIVSLNAKGTRSASLTIVLKT